MLSAPNRMRRPRDFTAAVRSGTRSGGRRLVVHQTRVPDDATAAQPALVGFVVSRAVGGAVVRNRVERRLRAQVRPRVASLPVGSRTVIRALPPSADATSAQLLADLERQLDRLDARSVERSADRPVAGPTSGSAPGSRRG